MNERVPSADLYYDMAREFEHKVESTRYGWWNFKNNIHSREEFRAEKLKIYYNVLNSTNDKLAIEWFMHDAYVQGEMEGVLP